MLKIDKIREIKEMTKTKAETYKKSFQPGSTRKRKTRAHKVRAALAATAT